MKQKTSSKKRVALPAEVETLPPMPTHTPNKTWSRVFGVLLIVFLGMVMVKKGWIVAAIVDGRPIFSWQLTSVLKSRYGQQTLEGMIGESLIMREAKKAGVSISDDEVTSKQQEILSSLGPNVNLEDFLAFQGITEKDFNKQLELQLTVERLLTHDVTFTNEELDAYIATNAATLTATEPAKLREEARAALINNMVSEKLQSWFEQVRQNAKVYKFL